MLTTGDFNIIQPLEFWYSWDIQLGQGARSFLMFSCWFPVTEVCCQVVFWQGTERVFTALLPKEDLQLEDDLLLDV